MANFDKTRAQAQKNGPAIPIAAKWKSVSANLSLLTHAWTWLYWAALKTFGYSVKPKDEAKPKSVHGMDCYNIFLYLTIEILWIAVLLKNSTMTKEARRCYFLWAPWWDDWRWTTTRSSCWDNKKTIAEQFSNLLMSILNPFFSSNKSGQLEQLLGIPRRGPNTTLLTWC